MGLVTIVPNTRLVLMFVVAEAVPKKILDLMNVEGLSRENVASHLQVYILAFVATIMVPFILHKSRVYINELTMIKC